MLPHPTGTRDLRPNWPPIVAIAALHAASLLAFVPWLFDWRSVIIAAVAVPVVGFGINLCYHRQLTHRSFRTPLWLEHALVALALCSLQESPVKWVANHRMHHNKSDRKDDPHSPLVSLFWSHCGWLFIVNEDTSPLESYQRYARDILEDPWYMKLARGRQGEMIYLLHGLVFFLIGYAWGGLQLGLSFVVWCVLVRTVVGWHVTWSVNSLCHRFGYRNFETRDESRNNALVGFLAAGEGWHNNHHANPSCASTQARWWEIDTIYYTIKLLERLGLATDVVEPNRKRTAP